MVAMGGSESLAEELRVIEESVPADQPGGMTNCDP